MSNSSFSEAQVYALQAWVLDDYAALSSSVLWVLDFIYMLPVEYDAIWSKKMSLHSMLFLVSRYGLSGQLGFNAFAGSYGASLSDTMYNFTPITFSREHLMIACRCSISYITSTAFGELSTTATLYLITLRVAAIQYQRKVALAVATALIIPFEVINVYQDSLVDAVSTKGTIYQAMVECMITPSEDEVSLSSKVAVTSGCIQLVFIIAMLGLLLRTTLRHVVEMRRFGQSSIVEAFMYDGIGTACGALAVTAIGIIDNIIGFINPESKFLAILNLGAPFEIVIPIILVNRLILNLLTTCDHDRTAQNSDTHISSMPEFAPISHPGATLNSTRWDNQCDGPVNEVSGTLRVPP